jgi:hypothetical protein
VLLSAIAAAQDLQIGSGNTAFADPPVPRPHTTPCVVTLYKGFKFADFNPKSFTYTPPAACPGPWAKVILQANFSINQGRQFDRTANIWIGPTNIYFGTTSEPSHTVARHWHVERDSPTTIQSSPSRKPAPSILATWSTKPTPAFSMAMRTSSSTRWNRISSRPAPPIKSSPSLPVPPAEPSPSTPPPTCSNKL